MRLTLLRASPGEGWPSMDRYAESLAGALPAALPAGWEVRMPLPPVAPALPYAQLLTRAFVYPGWARRQGGDLLHILDHSYAGLLATLPAEQVAQVSSASQITGENYGALKALCEAEVAAAFPAAACMVRAGLIVGPHDPTDRFTY